eukprot:SAG31_NODE_1772_length_7306_cov_3.341335_3_plen_83_part_00
MLRSRDGGAQLYELVGFPYFGVYLGILDVYYAAGARQEVHCELVSGSTLSVDEEVATNCNLWILRRGVPTSKTGIVLTKGTI